MPSRPHPFGPAGIYTLRDAFAAGWTPDAVGHAVDTGRSIRLRRGSYLEVRPRPADPPYGEARRRLLQTAIATALHADVAVLSHAPATVAHGLPLLPGVGRPCLSVPRGTPTTATCGVHLHRAALPDDQLTRFRGVVATAPARTALDLARECGVESGVVAADAALRSQLCTPTELATTAEFCGAWPWGKRALAAAALANPAAESPLESVSRVKLSALGIPAPTLQQVVLDAHGMFVARVDFYWDEYGVVGEADGALKYDGREALLAERRREQALEDLGLIVVRWEWPDLARFALVARRLDAAFARRLRRGSRGRNWVLPC